MFCSTTSITYVGLAKPSAYFRVGRIVGRFRSTLGLAPATDSKLVLGATMEIRKDWW